MKLPISATDFNKTDRNVSTMSSDVAIVSPGCYGRLVKTLKKADRNDTTWSVMTLNYGTGNGRENQNDTKLQRLVTGSHLPCYIRTVTSKMTMEYCHR